MTQQEFAELIGVTQSTISKWLTGTHLPVGLAKRKLQESYPEIYKKIQRLYEEKNGNRSDNS